MQTKSKKTNTMRMNEREREQSKEIFEIYNLLLLKLNACLIIKNIIMMREGERERAHHN